MLNTLLHAQAIIQSFDELTKISLDEPGSFARDCPLLIHSLLYITLMFKRDNLTSIPAIAKDISTFNLFQHPDYTPIKRIDSAFLEANPQPQIC